MTLPNGGRSDPRQRTIPSASTGDTGETVRLVPTTKDYIRFEGRLWKVPQAFRGERVAIRPRGPDGHYGVFFGAHQIASIDLTGEEKCQ